MDKQCKHCAWWVDEHYCDCTTWATDADTECNCPNEYGEFKQLDWEDVFWFAKHNPSRLGLVGAFIQDFHGRVHQCPIDCKFLNDVIGREEVLRM